MAATDKRGETALYEAVAGGRVEIARLLLEAGAGMDTSCSDGIAPLGLAVTEGDVSLFNMLRAAGARVLYHKKGKAVTLPPGALTIKQVKRKVGKIPRRLGHCNETVFSENDQRVTPPVFTKKITPKYPMRAVQKRLTGYVVLEAILGKDGRVRNIKIIKHLYDWAYAFEVNAALALGQWEFKPGTVKGRAADVRMTLKIDYVLQ